MQHLVFNVCITAKFQDPSFMVCVALQVEAEVLEQAWRHTYFSLVDLTLGIQGGRLCLKIIKKLFSNFSFWKYIIFRSWTKHKFN